MTCNDMLEQISAALDGELTAEEKVQLDRHLSQCDSCRALFDELSAIHGACAHLEAAPPPALRACILEQLPPQKQQAKVIVLHWKRWAAMAATFVLVALAAWHLPETLDKPGPRQSVSVQEPSPTPVAEPADLADADLPALASEEPLNVTDSVAPASSPDKNAGIAPLMETPETALSFDVGGEVVTVHFGDQPNESEFAADKAASAPLSVENSSTAKQATEAADAAKKAAPQPFSAARSMMSKEAGEYETPESGLGAAPQNGLVYSALPPSGGAVDSDGLSLQCAQTALDEVPEPHPEMSGEELITAALLKTGCQLPSGTYCGVLTLEGSAPLIGYQPDLVLDGVATYTLPKAAFDALIKELEVGGIPFDLRATGDDVSPTAETGVVTIVSAN